MDKNEIAAVLKGISVLLDLKGENPFKVLAYSNAARTLENLAEDLGVLIRENRLDKVKGIGLGLKEKITELHVTGRLPYYEELKESFPPGLLECLRVPGLGPKKVRVLWEKLGIDSIGDLRMACERGMVAGLAGFGEKTQAKIMEGIASLERYRGLFLFEEAWNAAQTVLAALKACRAVRRVETAGSLRRRKEVVRDLDFVVSTGKPEMVMKIFTSLPDVEKITSQGKTKSSVILKAGIQADVRCVSENEFPFALAYFTGSKEHNIAMRQRAVARGEKLNEYGLFEIRKGTEKLIPCRDEAALYRRLGLDYVEPELREDSGEIEAAEKHALPRLIAGKDIRGTFHCHTRWSDGRATIEQMAGAAVELGWEYLGIAEHSRSSAVANGLNEKKLLAQILEIEKLNKRFADKKLKFRLFAGNEVDILADGRLDFSDEILSRLDYVVAAIHQGFGGDEARQTARIVKAISNSRVTMLGHPTGRLLLSREPYKLDLKAVIEVAAKNRTIIELNCNDQRMDLDWRWWKTARDQGVLCAINPDAHSTGELSQVALGVGVARKGWLRAGDVLNTRSAAGVMKILKTKR